MQVHNGTKGLYTLFTEEQRVVPTQCRLIHPTRLSEDKLVQAR